MKGAICMLLGILLGVCVSEYILINTKSYKPNPCEDHSSTALIERFFNIIFTEFHATPPACVCIQMCFEQPTYCYPNGCLRRPERKKIAEDTFMVDPVGKVQFEGTTKSVMFVVDNHKDFMDDLLEGPKLNSYVETTYRPSLNDLIFRPNPFKEMVLKNRKLPKLEMKYNLREQVKNTKSDKLIKDKIDLSKTRWPLNKHLLYGKQPFNRIRHYKNNDDIRQTKFFISMFPEYGPANYTPTLYNKYLSKRDNNGVNVETLYLYQTDVGNFSLENLIDNLIESSLDKSKKDVNINLDLANDTLSQVFTTETNINCTEIDILKDKEKLTSTSINNTVSIISINSTNETTDVNKYIHDTNMENQNIFSEMITSMSHEIDKQNKANLDFMERVTDRRKILKDLLFITTDKSLENSVIDTNISVTERISLMPNQILTSKTNASTDFSTPQISSPDKKTPSYKKNKQRIIRKLKHRKLN